MEFVAILATVAVVVLQIITISVVVSMKKKIDELTNQKPASSNNNDRERNDRSFRPQRNSKRPTMDSRPRPQTPQAASPSASVDQVEKSLRDINLKLKNAERDQENARKKIQGNFPKDLGKRRDSRDNGPKGGRDNNRRDPPPPRSGNNWQDRGNRRDNRNPSEMRKSPNEDLNVPEKKIFSEELPVQQVDNSTITPVVSAAVEPSGNNDSDSNLQHGRKVTVKRRMLKEEDSIIANSSPENSDSSNVSEKTFSEENQSNSVSNDSNNESEIKFGRK